jgi:hypothetical protein
MNVRVPVCCGSCGGSAGRPPIERGRHLKLRPVDLGRLPVLCPHLPRRRRPRGAHCSVYPWVALLLPRRAGRRVCSPSRSWALFAGSIQLDRFHFVADGWDLTQISRGGINNGGRVNSPSHSAATVFFLAHCSCSFTPSAPFPQTSPRPETMGKRSSTVAGASTEGT